MSKYPNSYHFEINGSSIKSTLKLIRVYDDSKTSELLKTGSYDSCKHYMNKLIKDSGGEFDPCEIIERYTLRGSKFMGLSAASEHIKNLPENPVNNI